MNLGQVLAMLAQGQDPQRYTAPQTQQSNTPFPWQQVAAMPPSEAEPIGFAQLPPVEVTASRLPQLPERMDPLSMYETQLYGGPLTQQAPPEMLAPPTYGFAAPEPSPSMSRMPPLPIRGMKAQLQPKEMSVQIPKGMTDVPMEEPVQPEQALAMAEQPLVEAPIAQAPLAEQPPKPVAPWKIGEPYKVSTEAGEYTVTGYNPQAMGKSPVRVTDAQGTIFRVDPDVDPEFYQQITDSYNKQVQSSKPAAELGGFTSKILIGQGDQGKWYDAKVDPVTNRVIYKMGNRTAVFDTPSTLKLGENFIGGTSEDDQNLVNVQQASAQILNPAIKKIQESAQDMPRTADKMKLRSGLTWELVPNENQENPMPEVVFYYQDGVNGQRLTLQQAEQQGLITRGTDSELQARKLQVDDMLAQRARGIQEAVGAEAKTNFDREIEQIDKQNALLAKEKATASADRVREIQKIEKKNQDRRDALLAQSAVSNIGAGGVTVIQGGTTEYKLPFNPNDFTGRLNMFSFEGFDTTGQVRSGTTSWSPDDYVNYIVDQAMPNVQTNPLITTARYKAGIGALSQRISDIQNRLYETLGDQSRDAVNDNTSVFQYRDKEGNVQEEQMSLTQALDEFQAAQLAYRNNPSQKNMELFGNAARRLSGNMYIAGLGDQAITPSPAESILQNISAGFDMPVYVNTRVPGSPVSPSGVIAEKAPPIDVSRPPSGGSTKIPPKPVPAFPINPTGVKNQFSGMEKWTRGYAPFTSLVSSPESWNFTATVYEPTTTKNTAQQNMGYALLSDTGRLEPSEQQSVADVFDKVNQYISSPAGKPARDAIAASIRDNLIELGMTHLQSIGESTFVKALDDIYNAPDQATADAKVRDFLKTYANRQQHGPKFVASGPGQESLGAQGGNYHTNYAVPGDLNNRTSHLFEQNLATLKDLAFLMRNSGVAYGHGTKHGVKPGTNVTWIANPLSRTYDDQGEYSVFTTPSATASPRAPIVVKSAQGGVSSIPALNKGNNNLPTNGELDPAATYTMQNLTRVWGGNRWTRIADVFDAVDASMGSPLIKIAEKYHKPDMYNPSVGKRPQDDVLTTLDNDSKKSIREMTAYNALMFSQFPPVRYRPFP